MRSILNSLEIGSERIVDSFVYVNDKLVGILLPSSFEGHSSSTGYIFLSGPKGTFKIGDENDKEAIFGALVDSGSILFGDEAQILDIRKLFDDEMTSRTASYFACIAKNCGEVLQAFSRLSKAKVLVIGCGGIGSLSSMQLAGSGFKNLVLVDPDFIEKSNFNRQILWGVQDLGQSKVDVLKRKIVSSFDNVSCDAIVSPLQDLDLSELIEGVDAVLLSADEPVGVGKKELCALLESNDFILVSSGYSHQRSIVEVMSMGFKEKIPDYHGLKSVNWKRCSGFIGPSFGPSNSEIAAKASSILIHAIGFGGSFKNIQNDHHIYSWLPKLCPG